MKLSTRSQATYCLRRGLSRVAEAWEKERRGEKARLVPEEFLLHSGRIWGRNEVGGDGGVSTGEREERFCKRMEGMVAGVLKARVADFVVPIIGEQHLKWSLWTQISLQRSGSGGRTWDGARKSREWA